MKRQHYTNEEKEKMLFRYASEQTDVQDLLQEAGIPKSTFNQWLREYDAQHNCQSENDYLCIAFSRAATHCIAEYCDCNRTYTEIIFLHILTSYLL